MQLSLFTLPGQQIDLFDHVNNMIEVDTAMIKLAKEILPTNPNLSKIYLNWEQYAPAEIAYYNGNVDEKIQMIIKAIDDRDWDIF